MAIGRRNPSPRPNRSFQYADDDEIKKISFVVTFAGVLTCAAGVVLVAALVPSARRILLFFIALNRGLKSGYRGTRSTQAALADAVARATSAGCSVRTLQRGMKVLIATGLIVETWWNLYDRQGKLVKYQPRAGEWETSKIRIYSLTPFALSLWAPQSKRRAVAESVEISAPSVEPVDASEPTGDTSPLHSPTYDKMTHHGNRIPKPSVCKSLVRVNVVTTSKTSNGESVESSPVGADASTGSTEGAEISTDSATGKKSKLSRGRPSITRGCSVAPPPKLAKGWKKNAGNIRLSLLAHVFHFLSDFPTRQADCLLLVAREETRPGAACRALPLCVDWGRVLSSWSSMSRGERWHVWRRDILPGLRSAVCAAPPDIERAEKQARRMAHVAGELQGRIERADQARADRKSETDRRSEESEDRRLGMLPEQIAESRDEKRERIALYANRLKRETNPDQRSLLTAAINALLRV